MMAPDLRCCAQLIESLNVGGAEVLAVRVANAMAEAGHESHLIVMSHAGALRGFVSSAVKLHELSIERQPIGRPLAFVRSVRTGISRLETVIHDERIDVIQSHLPGANFWGLLLILRGQSSILSTIHNNQEFRYGDSDNPLRAMMRKRAYALLISRNVATIAVSAEVRDSLARDLHLSAGAASRIVAIPNGVTVPPPRDDSARLAARARFGLDPEAFVFLAAGRLCEQKNFIDLISAAAVVNSRNRKWRLVIAGDGPDRSKLESLIAGCDLIDRVTLPGNILEMPQLMAAVDAFIMSSLWEGLPLVLLEAMAAGLPVIGTRIPGIMDVVRDGSEGILVDAGDSVGLAVAMHRMLEEPEYCKMLGASGRKVVIDRFDFAGTVDRLRALYARCGGPTIPEVQNT